MTHNANDGQANAMGDATRAVMNALSANLLRLHKLLLDDAKRSYEESKGPIANVNTYFQLVIDHEHFSWLRKLSSLVALVDEATMPRRLASETDAQALLNEAVVILSFKDPDESFNLRYESALQKNQEALVLHLETVGLLK